MASPSNHPAPRSAGVPADRRLETSVRRLSVSRLPRSKRIAAANAENLGEILGLDGRETSEAVNTVLDESSQEIIDSLEDFDFDF